MNYITITEQDVIDMAKDFTMSKDDLEKVQRILDRGKIFREAGIEPVYIVDVMSGGYMVTTQLYVDGKLH